MLRRWNDVTRDWRNRSVSVGTDVDLTLIRAFAIALLELSREAWRTDDANDHLPPATRHLIYSRTSRILSEDMEDASYIGTARAHEDKLWLMEQLNRHAPVGYEFRTTPEDASNYGFWKYDETLGEA